MHLSKLAQIGLIVGCPSSSLGVGKFAKVSRSFRLSGGIQLVAAAARLHTDQRRIFLIGPSLRGMDSTPSRC